MVLKEYWPRCLQELIEFQQIANAEQPEFEKVVSDVKSAADDFFLVSLSEYGCERWEKILGLSVEPGDTLQDRRDRILIKYLDQLPYGRCMENKRHRAPGVFDPFGLRRTGHRDRLLFQQSEGRKPDQTSEIIWS